MRVFISILKLWILSNPRYCSTIIRVCQFCLWTTTTVERSPIWSDSFLCLMVHNQDSYLQELKIDLYIASFFKLLWRFSDSFTLDAFSYFSLCTRNPMPPCFFWKVLRWWESSPVDQCYKSKHVYSKSVPMPTLMKLIFLFVFIPIQSTCICVPRMDIKFSFHTMKWWITQENLLK